MDTKDYKLEEKCENCDGSGRSYGDDCPGCHGTGYVPTDAGERILALLRHQLHIGRER
jgi:DnaJ-class molecular chaperone